MRFISLHGAFHIDIRSLAAFRILFGLLLLLDTYTRFSLGRYDLYWYTDDGFLAPSELPHRAPLHQIWFYRGSSTFQAFCVGLSVVLSLCFTLGVSDSAIPKVFLFIVHTAEQSRNMPAHDGSDAFVRHLLLWSCFLPLDRVWSVHSWKRSRQMNKALFPNNSVSGLPCLALKLQIVLMYLGTVLLRIETMGWKSEWMPPQLTAVHYALSGSFAARNNFMTRYVRRTPRLSKLMTAQAMIIEGLAPVWCLCGGAQRHYAALTLVLLHLGLIFMVNLVNWQVVGMLVQVIWIPSSVWDRWVGELVGDSGDGAHYKKTDGDANENSKLDAVLTPANPSDPIRSNLISRSFQAFFFFYMIYNWMGNRNWIAKHDNGDIGEGLRLSQYWVMYRTVGKTAHNVFLTGYCDGDNAGKTEPENLQVVDLLHYVKTGQWKIQAPLEILHNDMTAHFPSARWERALSQWTQNSFKRQAIKVFCKKLCTLVNEDRERMQMPRLSEIEFSWIDVELNPPGSRSRYKRSSAKRHSVPVVCPVLKT